MSELRAPVPQSEDFTISSEIWDALTEEINAVVLRIDANEDLVPEDVANVRALKKQVDAYLTQFNKALRSAQTTYKQMVENQLIELGYNKIEAYIVKKREEQTAEQNAKLDEKRNHLQQLVETELSKTQYVKDTVLAKECLPAFIARFPNVNSYAKSKEIKNWGPYEAIIRTSLQLLDVFFGDTSLCPGAMQLPVTSATMQTLLAYLRDGNLEHLSMMRTVFEKDAEVLLTQKLKAEIATKEIALDKISEIMGSEETADEKIKDIARIIRLAETL